MTNTPTAPDPTTATPTVTDGPAGAPGSQQDDEVLHSTPSDAGTPPPSDASGGQPISGTPSATSDPADDGGADQTRHVAEPRIVVDIGDERYVEVGFPADINSCFALLQQVYPLRLEDIGVVGNLSLSYCHDFLQSLIADGRALVIVDIDNDRARLISSLDVARPGDEDDDPRAGLPSDPVVVEAGTPAGDGGVFGQLVPDERAPDLTDGDPIVLRPAEVDPPVTERRAPEGHGKSPQNQQHKDRGRGEAEDSTPGP